MPTILILINFSGIADTDICGDNAI